METRVRNGKLVQKLIFAAVAAIIGVATVLTVMGGIKISDTYMQMVQEELSVAAAQIDDEMNNVWDGTWSYQDGILYKGEENVMAEYEEILDDLKSVTGLEYSIIYGKERVITTMKDSSGKKAIGHNISDSLYDTVVTKRQSYFAQAAPAGDPQEYYI